jgi:hypothetical protein
MWVVGRRRHLIIETKFYNVKNQSKMSVGKILILMFIAGFLLLPACRNDECSRTYSPRAIYVDNAGFDPSYLLDSKGCNENVYAGIPEPYQTTSTWSSTHDKPAYKIEIGLGCHCGEVLVKNLWGNQFDRIGTYVWASKGLYSYDSAGAGAHVISGYYTTTCGIPLPGLCPPSENCTMAWPPTPYYVHNFHVMDAINSVTTKGVNGCTLYISWLRGHTFCCQSA